MITSRIMIVSLLYFLCPVIKAQENKVKLRDLPDSMGSFTSIRNKDFTQLIGAATSGISINYNSDKAVINGSFTLKTLDSTSGHPIWIQLLANIGTTTSLFILGQKNFQPDFSLSPTTTFIVTNKYFYDCTFSCDCKPDNTSCITNYENLKNNIDLNEIETNSDFRYTQALRDKIQKSDSKFKIGDRLYTAKRINWINILPEWGGSKFTFFDKNKEFSKQMSTPYYRLWGLSVSFNHYWYVNNEDVHWDGWPTTHFFFYKLALRYGTNNNTEILKKTTINDVSRSDTSSGMIRQVVKSTSAYNGIYEKYTALSPSFEVLYSLAKSFAFDLFGNYNFLTQKNKQTEDNGNIAAGLYFFTNSNGSKVNIGIYYQRSLSNTPTKEIIGIKTKIPINF